MLIYASVGYCFNSPLKIIAFFRISEEITPNILSKFLSLLISKPLPWLYCTNQGSVISMWCSLHLTKWVLDHESLCHNMYLFAFKVLQESLLFTMYIIYEYAYGVHASWNANVAYLICVTSNMCCVCQEWEAMMAKPLESLHICISFQNKAKTIVIYVAVLPCFSKTIAMQGDTLLFIP